MQAADAVVLVERFTALALSIANRWAHGRVFLREEFRSAAAATLWRYALRFTRDPAHGLGFFARGARREINAALAAVLKRERRTSPCTFAPQPDPGADPLAAVAGREPSPDQAAELADDLRRLPGLLAALPADRRDLVVRHIARGETLAALGAERGTSGSNVGQLIGRALGTLREAAGGT